MAKYPAHERELRAHANAASAATVDDAHGWVDDAEGRGAAAGRAAAAASHATNYSAAAAYASAAVLSPGFSSGFATATSAFWSAVSTDAKRVDEGAAASAVAWSPLWPNGPPPWPYGQQLWEEIKQTLHAAKQDWQVWTIWYEDRLEGRPREEKRELAYVRIDNDLWKQGPAIVNAEIKRRIGDHTPSPLGSSVSFGLPPARAVARDGRAQATPAWILAAGTLARPQAISA